MQVRISPVQTPATPWTLAHQAPLSMMGLSRQEYWSGLSFTPPGHLPYPGIKSTSPVSPPGAGRFFTTRVIWEALAKVNFQLFYLAGLLKKLSVFNSTCKKNPFCTFKEKEFILTSFLQSLINMAILYQTSYLSFL